MKKFLLVSVVTAFFGLTVSSCENPTTTDSSITPKTHSSARLSAATQARLSELRAKLPADYTKRLTINSTLLLKRHPEYRNLVNKALGVITPTPCDDNTSLNQWLGQQLADWDRDVIFFAIITGMLDFPTYDALLFENNSANQSFGVNGENTQRLTKTFKDLKRFWDIQTDDMVMVPMHGSMLRDRARVIRIDQILNDDSPAKAAFYADLIQELLAIVPQYRNGNHPIFTFNAFAQPTFIFPPVGVIPNKIVMGDGILQAYAGIGYGDIAPQAVLAHEFGHHIQFQRSVFGDVESPEATRRTELMADAFSAYFLSHARGASMQWKRVQQFLQVFYNIGDCSFTSDGHHGTPTQRMAAANWAYSVANGAQKQGQILPSQTFISLFDAQLPNLVTQ